MLKKMATCTVVLFVALVTVLSMTAVVNAAGVNIWAEAEDGIIGAPNQKMADKDCSNGYYVEYMDGDQGTVTVKFNVPEDGDYYLWGRAMAISKDDDSMFVSVDGEPATGYKSIAGNPVAGYLWDIFTISVPESDIPWEKWTWRPVTDRDSGEAKVVYSLKAGEHSVVFLEREDHAKLDKVLITNDPDYVPEGLGGENKSTSEDGNKADESAKNPSTGDPGLIGYAVLGFAGISGLVLSRKRIKK